ANLLNPGNVGDLGWRIVGTGDFHNDGKTDLLFQPRDGTLAVWLLNGIDLVSAELLTPSIAGPGWSVVATGDFNKDGKRDIIFQHTDGSLAAWMMNGTTLVDVGLWVSGLADVGIRAPRQVSWKAGQGERGTVIHAG
ncbi:MAG: VCBS repeat-containing protein, partial [Verrucomicrobiota bacterium]